MRNFGSEIWEEIEAYLNFNSNEIITNHAYPDELIPQIVDTLIMLRQSGDHDSYMEMFGKLI